MNRTVRLNSIGAALAVIVAAVLIVLTIATPAAHGARTVGISEAGGSITRNEMNARSLWWINMGVAYDPSSAIVSEWNEMYRKDQAGYVSHVWHTATNLNMTGLFKASRKINARDLKRGDMLASEHHAMVFVEWANTAHTQARIRELSAFGNGGMVERVTPVAGNSAHRYGKVVN